MVSRFQITAVFIIGLGVLFIRCSLITGQFRTLQPSCSQPLILRRDRIARMDRQRDEQRLNPVFESPNLFWALYEPEVTCPHEERVGNIGDGAKWICDLPSLTTAKSCLVMSFGSAGDDEYERAIAKSTKCDIQIFDPSPRAAGMVEKVKEYGAEFHQIGLGRGRAARGLWDARTGDSYHLSTLREIREKLGYVNNQIDILKIDIEGYEYAALDDIMNGCNANVKEIQVEFHFWDLSLDKRKLSKDEYSRIIREKITSAFMTMRDCNFYLSRKEYNYLHYHKAVELCFVNATAFGAV
mmetsp:Transcript_30765/g.67176  ORF Transcript_30765/g.67176 Transcript_30765/m.67176 type:complete len:297 (+) Transcript_30765:80-970(+)|eukprot:CAMPEP_0118924284 /NCGR_PEP_ID=MMETSP1169-20130426/2485_1 /TAXON_ID=36882 /ORGANISM="Pyramimonas obovata, Strain CCMP722" /LENGTH=296 /DNA_ID=CAMNT_0006865381 /DNA_START=65 /DNA_END=955 /DNA_ORIENTATION=+